MNYLLDYADLQKICERTARAVKQSPDLTASVWFDPAICRVVVVHRGYQNNLMKGFEELGEFRTDRSVKSITDDLVAGLINLRADGFDLEILSPKPDVYDCI
ncbi:MULTISPECIES: hypothetical protein [unclassified Thiomonas]|jgi:hypothetical protein|uniref:hypothetical protein n=1 Tax=unclassified Thiomonas TaxID=2625466 RepID=UPI000BD20965|nr:MULTISPECIES: hypothetical protein [unclassified Thiomonas]OZB72196.1 MAG: hypothetical protein B7X30_01000 [Thiomonas sp. 13-64-67]